MTNPAPPPDPTPAPGKPQLLLVTSRSFMDWLAGEQLSLALSAYHSGALVLLGRKPGGDASVFVSGFDRAMGLWGNERTLWLAGSTALWRLEDCLGPDRTQDGFDRFYIPRAGYITGDLDIHDLAVDQAGRLVFVNSRFSCLATLDERFNFAPLWQPPFLTALAPEDRCHLNGLALRDGVPRYVTAHARSDVAEGWRDFRVGGGVVLDVTSNEVVAQGLSMPHSPRWHEGRLWLLNSGTGELGFLEEGTGKFEPVTFLPGYARGLAFHGRYAVVGLSKPRREHAFQGLPLDERLREKQAAPRCGLEVIEVATGAVLHTARFEVGLEELYDVVVLPGVVRPRALSPTGTLLAQHWCFAQGGQVHYWSASPSPVVPRS